MATRRVVDLRIVWHGEEGSSRGLNWQLLKWIWRAIAFIYILNCYTSIYKNK